MDEHNSTQRLPGWAVGCAVAPLVLLIAIVVLVKLTQRQMQVETRNRIRQQIADVKRGMTDIIYLNDESDGEQFSEFINAQGTLVPADRCELRIEYSSRRVDDLLRKIAGIRGVKSLLLYKTAVSDVGIEFISTMPELRQVKITELPGGVTAAKLEELRARLPECTISIVADE